MCADMKKAGGKDIVWTIFWYFRLNIHAVTSSPHAFVKICMFCTLFVPTIGLGLLSWICTIYFAHIFGPVIVPYAFTKQPACHSGNSSTLDFCLRNTCSFQTRHCLRWTVAIAAQEEHFFCNCIFSRGHQFEVIFHSDNFPNIIGCCQEIFIWLQLVYPIQVGSKSACFSLLCRTDDTRAMHKIHICSLSKTFPFILRLKKTWNSCRLGSRHKSIKTFNDNSRECTIPAPL